MTMHFRPAFPSEGYGEKHDGVTQLMFMAAHAPKVIPEWFKPTILEPKPKELLGTYLIFGKASSHKHRELFESYYFEGSWSDERDPDDVPYDGPEIPKSFKEEVKQYEVKMHQSWDAARAWAQKYEEQRHFQWPIYWAQNVIDNHP